MKHAYKTIDDCRLRIRRTIRKRLNEYLKEALSHMKGIPAARKRAFKKAFNEDLTELQTNEQQWAMDKVDIQLSKLRDRIK